MCVGTHVPCTGVWVRTVWSNWFSLFTMWVPGIDLGWLSLSASASFPALTAQSLWWSVRNWTWGRALPLSCNFTHTAIYHLVTTFWARISQGCLGWPWTLHPPVPESWVAGNYSHWASLGNFLMISGCLDHDFQYNSKPTWLNLGFFLWMCVWCIVHLESGEVIWSLLSSLR